MMEWTDRHCRFFHRLLTRRALLYTEMLTTGAVLPIFSRPDDGELGRSENLFIFQIVRWRPSSVNRTVRRTPLREK
jgi:tRNA-dihydrouridine synthase